MEHNVVTLETAQKLKAAGYPQTTFFRWYLTRPPILTNPDNFEANYQEIENLVTVDIPDTSPEMLVAAPTAQELADQLPAYIERDGKCYHLAMTDDTCHDTGLSSIGIQPSFSYSLDGQGYHITTADAMAEALASLYLKLKEAEPTENVDPDRSKITPPKEQDHE